MVLATRPGKRFHVSLTSKCHRALLPPRSPRSTLLFLRFTTQHEGKTMADQTLLAEVRRELTAIRIEAERLSGRVQALETIIERYGHDDDSE